MLLTVQFMLKANCKIFSVAGQNVTELNGELNGIYVVKTAKGIQKVAVNKHLRTISYKGVL